MPSFEIILSEILRKIAELVSAPIKDPQMLWMLIPLLASIVFIEIYLGHYKGEELGWNSAASNSLVLLFVGLNLCGYLSARGELLFLVIEKAHLLTHVQIIRSFIAGFVVFEAILLFLLNFFHILPKKIAFKISSGIILNFLAAIGLILIYSDISFTWYIIPAIILIFIILVLVLKFIELLEPKNYDSEDEED